MTPLSEKTTALRRGGVAILVPETVEMVFLRGAREHRAEAAVLMRPTRDRKVTTRFCDSVRKDLRPHLASSEIGTRNRFEVIDSE